MPLSQAFIDKIKSCGVRRLAEKYTKLEKVGDDSYVGRCPNPAHRDTNASFTIYNADTEEEAWCCYGCHCGEKGGNNYGSDNIAFMQWVSTFNGGRLLSFPEAVAKVAEFYGIDMEQSAFYYVYLKNDCMASAYQENITGDVIEYLHSRGINDESIEKWRIGFDGERITFPITDRYGKVLGFSNRKLKESTPGGKYVNSRNSKVFIKRNLFYGVQFVDFRNHELLITEGQTDAIMAQQYGLLNTVASMTCHLSEAQIKFIKDNGFNPIMCYDDDAAGIEGAKRAMNALYNANIKNVRVLMLPSGKDMADVALKLKDRLPEFVKAKTMTYSQYVLKGLADIMDAQIINVQQKIMPSIKRAIECINDRDEKILAESYIQHRLKLWA